VYRGALCFYAPADGTVVRAGAVAPTAENKEEPVVCLSSGWLCVAFELATPFVGSCHLVISPYSCERDLVHYSNTDDQDPRLVGLIMTHQATSPSNSGHSSLFLWHAQQIFSCLGSW
jgi:hypothetical protein